ncbi:MAG: MBL fold metallo-hydrolase [Bacteroidota bacterium]
MRQVFKILISFLLLLQFLFVAAQKTQLEIHQINVGNGDGALINLYDNDKLVYTIVIDGGLASSSSDFVPYLKNFIPDMEGHPGKKEIDWVILSHNHQDHFNGLVQMFNDDAFIIREITDQGGYGMGDGAYKMPLKDALNTNCVPFITRDLKNKKNKDKPQPALSEYVKAVQRAYTRAKAFDGESITPGIVFDTTAKAFKNFRLPDIGGVEPVLYFIAANGFTRGLTTRDIGPGTYPNPNNFSFGWILEFGQFRFYSGGDLGGYPEGYTDQETQMAAYLTTKYPDNLPLTGIHTAQNFPGHVCVMKTNHHGSTKSSRPEFLSALAYSAIVTSAGKHSRWKIPTVEFVDRVADNPAFGAKQGIYFTQLYDYTKGNTALKEAKAKFAGKAAYDFIAPGPTADKQYSFVFLVKPKTSYTDPHGTRTVDIEEESLFTVNKVRTDTRAVSTQYVFLCHKPS